MKILNINNKNTFKGLMDIRVRDNDYCYNAVVRTSDEDDKKISSLISDGEIIDCYNAAPDDDTFVKHLNKTKEFVNMIKNICAQKRLFFPKLDYDFDCPRINRKDTEITFHTACEPWKKDQWKQIDINLYTRKPEDIKQNITKLIDENKKYPNFNCECIQKVNLITKDCAKNLPFEENYLLLLDNEFILQDMKEKLKKESEKNYNDDLPF